MLEILALSRHIFILMKTKDLAGLIKSRRAALRIDQRALSEIAGVSVHTLSNMEAGAGNPTLANLERVLHALGMEIRIGLKEQE